MVTDAPDTIYRVERSWRHGIVFADVLTTPGLPPLSRLVYACLTTYANAAGEAWPSAQRVASDLGIGRSTVLEAYSHLENAGVIRRIRRTAPSGRSLVTVIRLLDRGSPADQGRVQEVDPAQGRVQEVDPNKNN